MVMGGEWAQKDARYAPSMLTLPLHSAHFREPWCPRFLVGCGAVLHRLKAPPQTSHVLCTAVEPQTG